MIETKFKDSELGPIPEDWDIKSIGALSLLMNDGPFGSDLKQEHYTSKKEARIIQLSNIGDNGWNDSNVKYTTFEYAFKIKKHIVKPGQIIVAKMMPAGRAIVCPTHEKCFVQGSDAIKICFTNEIKPDYFVYFTKSQSYINFVEENTQGSTRQRISITKYRDFPCLLPSTIDEQERIAEALSDVDALIKELDVLIEKKRMVLKATMQDLLTARRRLPGFSEPWQEVKLGDVSTIFRGGSPRPIEKYLTQSVNGYNWIKIGDVKIGEKYITKTQERIIPQGINYTRLVNPGDFILSNSMSFGRPYILKICGCIHDGWLAISEYSNYFDTEYLYYLLGSDLTYKQYCTLAAGSGVLNLNKALVSSIILRAPRNLSEQQAIAEILSDMDSEIAELGKKKEKYTSIRQGMMQQLLTGKIRLI